MYKKDLRTFQVLSSFLFHYFKDKFRHLAGLQSFLTSGSKDTPSPSHIDKTLIAVSQQLQRIIVKLWELKWLSK